MGFEQDVRDAMQAAVARLGSIKALADCAGLNPATLYRWIQAERDPTLSGLSKVMDYLDLTVQKRGEAAPFPPIPKPGEKGAGLATSIMEANAMALEKAKLEGKLEMLNKFLDSISDKEKNAG